MRMRLRLCPNSLSPASQTPAGGTETIAQGVHLRGLPKRFWQEDPRFFVSPPRPHFHDVLRDPRSSSLTLPLFSFSGQFWRDPATSSTLISPPSRSTIRGSRNRSEQKISQGFSLPGDREHTPRVNLAVFSFSYPVPCKDLAPAPPLGSAQTAQASWL